MNLRIITLALFSVNAALACSPFKALFGGCDEPKTMTITIPAPPVEQYAWEKGVKAITIFSDGRIEENDVNALQFATPETAAKVAAILGLKVTPINLDGFFSKWTRDMLLLTFDGNPNSAGLNAGLVADLFKRYGSAPGSYGRYLVDRDIASIRGGVSRLGLTIWARR